MNNLNNRQSSLSDRARHTVGATSLARTVLGSSLLHRHVRSISVLSIQNVSGVSEGYDRHVEIVLRIR